jgi:hypothetical protein
MVSTLDLVVAQPTPGDDAVVERGKGGRLLDGGRLRTRAAIIANDVR